MTRTLTARAVLVACTVAVVSVLVTALVATPLAARAIERQARQSLSTQADVVAATLRAAPRQQAETRLINALRKRDIDLYVIENGVPDRDGLPANVVNRLQQGRNVSGTREVADQLSIVEGRTLPNGNGVVLVDARRTGVWAALGRNLWLPLLAGLLAGVVAGALLARKTTKPIREAARAATRLRAGDNKVRVPVEPPREVEELAHALNDLAEALETSEGRQRDFLLSVSHELRTPLTTIRGYAEALADGVVGAEGAPRAGQTVLAEAERLDRLVSDLLALARLDAVDFPLSPIPMDLARLVAEAGEAWRPRCDAAGVVLRVEVVHAPIRAFADPGRTRQVVDGLMENALRIVPAGAPIVLTAGTQARGPMLEVRDGGPGFSDDDLAVAFERGALNQRYRGIRKTGSGLGLALAAGLVRRMGGRIEAGHAPEGGARFTVVLPDTPRTQA